jgi:hypothetical protein
MRRIFAALKDWRESHLLLADVILSMAIVTIGLSVALANATADELLEVLNGSRSATYSAIASIAGSLLGFIITAVSIIAAFGASPKFDLLRKSSQYQAIFQVYFSTIHWLALTTGLALVGLLFDTDRIPQRYLTLAACLVVAITTFRVWGCVWILQKMTDIVVKPIEQTQPAVAGGSGNRSVTEVGGAQDGII